MKKKKYLVKFSVESSETSKSDESSVISKANEIELLVETAYGEHDAIDLAQRYWRDWEPLQGRPVKSVTEVFTEEVPPIPEGCDWWRYEPERERNAYAYPSFQKWVPVVEDWCPSFVGNYAYVEILVAPRREVSGGRAVGDFIRVMVLGGDDTGMEKNYPLGALDEALADYNWIEIGITFEDLWKRGFTGAS